MSADCADATHDDAATSCKIDPKASSERRSFLPKTRHLVARVHGCECEHGVLAGARAGIAPGATVTLLFAATFDNTVLHLPVRPGGARRGDRHVRPLDGERAERRERRHQWQWRHRRRRGMGAQHPARASGSRCRRSRPTTARSRSTTRRRTSRPQETRRSRTPVQHRRDVGHGDGELQTAARTAGRSPNCATGTGGGDDGQCWRLPVSVDGSVGLQACNTQDLGATPACTAGTLGCGWSNGQMNTNTQRRGATAAAPPACYRVITTSSVLLHWRCVHHRRR